jgi:sugar-specific transcriptional regulator TrmB
MIEQLRKLGLTDGESKVYYALLKKGSSTVGPIVKESGVAYSNIYEILERLINKGIVTYIFKEKTKYFQTTNIENIEIYLAKKQQELDKQKEMLSSIKKEINTISMDIMEEAEIFVGKKSLRSAYGIMLQNTKKKDDFLFFYNTPCELAEQVEEFYLTLGKKFKNSGVNLKGLTFERYRNTKGIKQTPWTKMKYVSFPIPPTMDICREKILIISWKRPMGFLIKSQELADSFKEYFYSIYDKAKH